MMDESGINIHTAGGAVYAPSWEAVAKLNAKLAAVMADIEPLGKDGKNTHFNYQYVTYEDLATAVRAAMKGKGLSFTWSVVNVERAKNTIVELEVCFGDAETGAMRIVSWQGEGQDTQDKGTAKAITSCVKYGLMRTLLTSDQDDADPDAGKSTEQEQRNNAPPTTARRPAVIEHSGNGDGQTTAKTQPMRPGTPEQVKSWLTQKAQTLATKGARANEGQRGAMVGALEALFPNEPKDMATQCRYSVQVHVFGVDSSKKLTDSQVLAFLSWAQTQDETSGRYVADPVAIIEAARIIEAVNVAAGQEKLV